MRWADVREWLKGEGERASVLKWGLRGETEGWR
jgi:hypothetical protein